MRVIYLIDCTSKEGSIKKSLFHSYNPCCGNVTNHYRIQHLRPVYALLSHLSSVLPDTLPQWLQHTVKRFNTIGCGCFGKSCQGKSSDCTHLLLFIDQTYRMRRRRRFEWAPYSSFVTTNQFYLGVVIQMAVSCPAVCVKMHVLAGLLIPARCSMLSYTGLHTHNLFLNVAK